MNVPLLVAPHGLLQREERAVKTWDVKPVADRRSGRLSPTPATQQPWTLQYLAREATPHYSPRTNASSAALVSCGASCCTQCPMPGRMVEPRKSAQAIPGSA